jgi:ketosteroid isomerase-like protein
MESIDLQRRLIELEARVARVEDIEAIRTLKCEHALASDDPVHLKQRLLAIVTDDIEFDYGAEFGRFQGKARLAELLEDTPFVWTFHCMIPKRIDVAPDGRTATGIWYLWEPALAPAPGGGEPRALWLAGVYTDTYRKQPDGRWLIARIALDTRLMAPYDIGWAKARIVPLGPSAWTTDPTF